MELGPLRQISQPCTDLDRAVDFYERVLGLPLLARFDPIAFFDLDGVRLLLELGDPAGPGSGSILYFKDDDIHATRADLEARGVVFVDDVHLIHRDDTGTFGPAGEGEWMTFFRDSEGNLLGLSARLP